MKRILVILLVFQGCLSTKNNSTYEITKIDTLEPEIRIENYNCAEKFAGYYNDYGYIISNFYEKIAYNVIDIDNDNVNDTLIILSPKNMIIPSENIMCKDEKISNRILLVNKKGSKLIFKNVIRNKFGSGTIGSEFIEKTDNGFKLAYHLGQACFFDYDINIIHFENNLFISSIKLRSGCPGEKEKIKLIKFSKKDFPLSSYKRTIIDSLKNSNHM